MRKKLAGNDTPGHRLAECFAVDTVEGAFVGVVFQYTDAAGVGAEHDVVFCSSCKSEGDQRSNEGKTFARANCVDFSGIRIRLKGNVNTV